MSIYKLDHMSNCRWEVILASPCKSKTNWIAHNILKYSYSHIRLCLIDTALEFIDLFGILSHTGSTSGPSRSPAPSQPQHHTMYRDQAWKNDRRPVKKSRKIMVMRTVFWATDEFHCLVLLLCKQSIVRTKPWPVLGICEWIVWETTEANITANCSEVSTRGVNNIEYTLWETNHQHT